MCKILNFYKGILQNKYDTVDESSLNLWWFNAIKKLRVIMHVLTKIRIMYEMNKMKYIGWK